MDPFEYLFGLETLGIKFGLDNIRALCAGLGHPERRFQSILVGGTNGKGSVTAMVEAALRAQGHRVARYTSPHLIRLAERFWVDGHPVDDEDLRTAIERVRVVADRLEADGRLAAMPTFFEVTTAVAFELFSGAGMDLAVLEVGLGGRLDATNCVEPIAAAITSIAVDHELMLGDSLKAIAGEKAGIVRPNSEVVVGRMPPEAHDAIAAICRDRAATMIRADRRVSCRVDLRDGRAVLTSARTSARYYGDVTLGLKGRHQADNAAVAVCLLEALGRAGVAISTESVVAGLTTAAWPGRLQTVVLSGGRRLLLDAAHNPASAAALADFLREVHPAPVPLVFGVMADKPIEGMLEVLVPCVSHVILTRTRGARAADPAAIATQVARIAPGLSAEVRPDPGIALEAAWAHGPMVCVAGSIFLIGEVLERLDAHS